MLLLIEYTFEQKLRRTCLEIQTNIYIFDRKYVKGVLKICVSGRAARPNMLAILLERAAGDFLKNRGKNVDFPY